MAIQDIANEIVALLRAGKDEEVGRRYWSPSVRSIEAAGKDPVAEGAEAVTHKGEWFVANNEVHGVKAEGPFVNGDQFAVHLTYDMTPKGYGSAQDARRGRPLHNRRREDCGGALLLRQLRCGRRFRWRPA